MRCAINNFLPVLCTMLINYVTHIKCHGRLVEPPSRSSMWRYGFQTPINYDDNQLFCGGYDVQWHQNGGRCGVCGDPYNGPRDNEAGGRYATGTIARHYTEGQTIGVSIDVTTNHGGYFEFRICQNNDRTKPVTESCLSRHLLQQPNGETKWHLPEGTKTFSMNLVLPRGLTCSQCVLQWKWNTASNWDCDASNNCCKGCGNQEQFYGCADVSISSSSGLFSNSGFVPSNIGSGHLGFIPSEGSSGQQGFIPLGSSPGEGFIPPGSSSGQQGFIPSGSSSEQQVFIPSGTNSGQNGFIPVGSYTNSNGGTSNQCQATALWRIRYVFADQWCRSQCAAGNCPAQYCMNSCRIMYG